jgi:hypothetical protein
MLLAEPRWVGHIYHDPVTHLCGARRFDGDADGRCDAHLLWGYECTFPRGETEADHLFPRWLGGPTEPTNRLVLCKTHNRSKAGDIHLYPWEDDLPEWLLPRIGKIGAALAVKRS